MKIRLAVGAASIAVLVLACGPAGADPKSSPFTLNCGQAGSFVATVGGNGDFTPAHVSDSNLVLHPVSFGEFTGVFTPADGSPPQDVTQPPFGRKTSPQNKKPTLSCTFHIVDENPYGVFVGDGSVTGWAS